MGLAAVLCASDKGEGAGDDGEWGLLGLAAVMMLRCQFPDSHEVVGLRGRQTYSINSVKAFRNLVAVCNPYGA